MSDRQQQITNRPPLIVAHRGASAEKPENTLAAFRRALERGVDAIELDVHVTRDGVVVVFHDDTLNRLTGGRGKLAAKTWRELSALRVRGTESIPTLIEVLRLTRGRAVVQIEIKAGVPVAPVVSAVKTARARNDVILASFSPGVVRDCYRLAPTIPRMLIAEGRRTPASQIAQLAACHANGLSVNQRAVRTAAYVHYFHSRGYVVWSWTVNDAGRMRELRGWGIDGILSDNPALLRSAI
jgi:glycerophosphoryl diester phosphodiesterase